MSNTILLAHSKDTDVAAIRSQLGEQYNCDSICAPGDCDGDLNRYALLLMEQEFAEINGLDFVSSVLSNHHLPILILSTPDDSSMTAEAMRLGVYNFVTKTGDYLNLLTFAVSDAIKRYGDQQYLKNTIVQLQEKVSTLETQLEQSLNRSASTSAQVADITPRPDTPETRLMQQIINCLKAGKVNLPAYPEIARRFNDLVKRGESVHQLTALLEKNSGVSSKLISIANSTYYRGMVPIKTLEQAINRIGITETRNYVELIMNRGLYIAESPKYGAYLNQLWEHSLACAYACQDLSRTILKKNPAELFTMGLFHDLGKLLLTQIIARLELSGAHPEKISLALHQEIVAKNHGKFGDCLLKRWKLADEYLLVTLYCDDISFAPKLTEELLIVSLSEKIVRDMGYGSVRPTEEPLASCKAARLLNITAEQIAKIKESVSNKMQAGLQVGSDLQQVAA